MSVKKSVLILAAAIAIAAVPAPPSRADAAQHRSAQVMSQAQMDATVGAGFWDTVREVVEVVKDAVEMVERVIDRLVG